MGQIKELFSTIEDTRHNGYVKHVRSDVLIMVIFCTPHGADNAITRAQKNELVINKRSQAQIE